MNVRLASLVVLALAGGGLLGRALGEPLDAEIPTPPPEVTPVTHEEEAPRQSPGSLRRRRPTVTRAGRTAAPAHPRDGVQRADHGARLDSGARSNQGATTNDLPAFGPYQPAPRQYPETHTSCPSITLLGDAEQTPSEFPFFRAPPRRKRAEGRWVWVPDRPAGEESFFSLDDEETPCEVGPCESVEAERRPAPPTRCRDCEASGDLTAPPRALRPAEAPAPRPYSPAVEELSEIIEQSESPLDGSLFDPGDDRHERRTARREALMRALGRVESELASKEETTSAAPAPQGAPCQSVKVLREVSFDLEAAAQRLEEAQLFYRADELRELATQLRQEARSAMGGWSLRRLAPTAEAESPVDAERDLGLELEQLRDDVRRIREALAPSPLRR